MIVTLSPKRRNPKAEELFEAHVNLVAPIAKRLKRSLPHELKDLIQAGLAGLWDAARHYDGSAPFAAWARLKIRGAILDSARADRLFGPQRVNEIRAPRPARAEMPVMIQPPERIESTVDAACIMALALHSLDEREYAVMEGIYRRGESATAVSQSLGISKALVSQIHAEALEKLKTAVMKRAA
jgi:RNA polymerase sigma factor (sigma-70 family)